MHKIVILLSCLAFACDGKRVFAQQRQVQTLSESNPVKSFATLLLATSPASVFQAPGAGGMLARDARGVAAKMNLAGESFPIGRRQAVIGAGLAITSALSAMPANADVSTIQIGPVKVEGKPQTSTFLLRDCFDGVPPPEGYASWFEEHLTSDFVAELPDGVKLDKAAWITLNANLVKSFPDFKYLRNGPLMFANSPTIITWTMTLKGTPSETDTQTVTAFFASGTKPALSKLKAIKVKNEKGQTWPASS